MKRYLKWLVLLLVVLVVLSILIITLSSGDTSKNRKIAQDLLEYHHRWEADPNNPSLLQNLTNLPFPDPVIEYPKGRPNTVVIGHDYDLFIIQLHQHYWIEHSITNASEWTLYRYWSWNDRRLVKHKLLTIIETNTPPH